MKKLFLILVFVPFIHSQLSTQLLLETLKQNPSLLLSNPELLRTVISAGKTQQPQPRREDCSALKKQNKLLRQMLSSVTGPGILNDLDFTESVKSQQVVNPAQLLKPVAQAPPKPTISLTSSLVTPPATWTTSMTTTSYVTTVTHTETQEVPIILRGQKVVTTIYESHTQVVTATEIKTSSIHMTPSPTWEVKTVTITPTAVAPAALPLNHLLKTASIPQPLILPQLQQQQPKKRNNKLAEAQVVEIDKSTSNRDDLRSAYGAFFASSAQRSAARFGDILRPVRNSNPLFSSQQDDYDYYEDFDQQFLAAQNKPVYVQSPPQKSKVFTLYFSGSRPGEFTTKLTRLAVDDNGQPILSRNKRDSDISPSKVLPIENTLPPSFLNELDSSDALYEIKTVVPESDLDSSMTVVTVTQTVTVTDPLVACSV